MLIVTPTDGSEESIRMRAEAGFRYLDMSFFDMTQDDSPFCRDNYMEAAAQVKARAEKYGMIFRQAHAPFPSSLTNPPSYTEKIFGRIVRSMEIAAYLGVKIIVVHPMQELPYHYNKKILFDENKEFYAKLLPYCKKFNIKVATENMWQWDEHRQIIVESTCGSPEEFCAYVDEQKDSDLVACLDLGHAGLIGEDAADLIHKLGHDRLKALHVHDNDYLHDSHMAPFVGKMDWDSITQALADINYDGDFTFEADGFFHDKPDGALAVAIKYLYGIGEYLVSEIERKKKP